MGDSNKPHGEQAGGRSALAEDWYRDNFLLCAWLLFLPPLGLYGAWQRDDYAERQRQIFIGVFAVVWLVSAAVGLLLPVYLLGGPVYAWLLWNRREYEYSTRLGFAIAAGIFAIASLAALVGPAASPGNRAQDDDGCTSVLKRGNCTYYRDSNCRVIARQCS